MKTRILVSLVASASLLASGASFAQAVKPCALITKAEAQAIASGTLGNGNEAFLAALNVSTCSYTGSGKDSTPAVMVTVSDAAKVYPGMDNAMLKKEVFGRTDKTTAPIPGIGEAAIYSQVSPTNSVANALVKGKVLSVHYEAADAAAKKDKVIGLLKSAASRL